jgi:hypothetical protein
MDLRILGLDEKGVAFAMEKSPARLNKDESRAILLSALFHQGGGHLSTAAPKTGFALGQ